MHANVTNRMASCFRLTFLRLLIRRTAVTVTTPTSRRRMIKTMATAAVVAVEEEGEEVEDEVEEEVEEEDEAVSGEKSPGKATVFSVISGRG